MLDGGPVTVSCVTVQALGAAIITKEPGVDLSGVSEAAPQLVDVEK